MQMLRLTIFLNTGISHNHHHRLLNQYSINYNEISSSNSGTDVMHPVKTWCQFPFKSAVVIGQPTPISTYTLQY